MARRTSGSSGGTAASSVWRSSTSLRMTSRMDIWSTAQSALFYTPARIPYPQARGGQLSTTIGRQVEAIHGCGKGVLAQRGFLRPGGAFLSAERTKFRPLGLLARYPQLWRNLWMTPVRCTYPAGIAVRKWLMERGQLVLPRGVSGGSVERRRSYQQVILRGVPAHSSRG